VITSRSASADCLADPRSFAARYDLEPEEIDSFVSMSQDLVALTPSFVTKRLRTLRGPFHRTLGLLDRRSRRLVSSYMEAHPPPDLVQTDQRQFGEFLVKRASNLNIRIEHGPVVADLARYEQLLNLVFWLAQPLRGAAGTATTFDQSTPLGLTDGARLAHFGWDLRQLRIFEPGSAASLPADPCDLVVFQGPPPVVTRSLRVHAPVMAALETIRQQPGTTAADVCGGPEGPIVLAGLAQLFGQGALQCR
jgi:hypothetical protein